MFSDDQIARMEYVAIRYSSELGSLCAELAERLALPDFTLEIDDQVAWAFCDDETLEINIHHPRNGDLQSWLPYAPANFDCGVSVVIGRNHATIVQREWDFNQVVAPIAQALADLTNEEAFHYGSWVSAEKSVRRNNRFQPRQDGELKVENKK